MTKVSVLALTAALAFVGCDALSSDEPIPFARLDLPASPVFVSGTTVIRDQSRLEAFARRQVGDPVPIPEVDFERHLVVGVFYGGSFHAGCSGDVEVIEAIRDEGDALVVEIGPLPDLGPCRAVVHPAEMVVVDAQASAVQFVGKVPK